MHADTPTPAELAAAEPAPPVLHYHVATSGQHGIALDDAASEWAIDDMRREAGYSGPAFVQPCHNGRCLAALES